MTLEPGSTLGPYQIADMIGSGGMGEVYRARDKRLGRDVAIKVIPAGLAADPDSLRRFENEARAAARLNHPNLLQIFDVGSHDGHPYLVTELLEGETLRERLASGPLNARRAITLGIGVAQGLAAAHDEGIVHRDLKPENLHLSNDGRVKILDFGLAKLIRREGGGDKTRADAPTVGADTQAGLVMGTVGYMAPEQVRGQPADARSDIFALGAILFEAVSGRRAFRGETTADTMSAILKEDPPELAAAAKEIPPAFDRIVHRCLEKSPARRFRSAHDLAFSLEAISTTSTSAGSGGFATIEGGAARVEMEIEPITHLPTYLHSARFAPDGQTVVYATRVDGGPLSLLMRRPETPDAIPLPISGGDILAISATGEMALQMNPVPAHSGVGLGTLAVAPMFGAAPRPLAPDITAADYDPSGRTMAVIRETGGISRIEYPLGTTLYETSQHVSYLRFSPRGDRIAFLDHPLRGDDRSSVAVIDLRGAKKSLTSDYPSAQGLAWTPDGEEIWISATKGGAFRSNIYGVSLGGEIRQVYAAPGGIRLHDIAKNGDAVISRVAYFTSIIAAGPGDTPERDISWLGHSLPAGVSDDGKTVVFTEQSHSIGPDYAVCVRGTDGSPVIRLGDGLALGISADGRWALAHRPYRDAPIDLHSTGLGEGRAISMEGYGLLGGRARFTPDGANVVLPAHDREGREGILVLSVSGAPARFLRLPDHFVGVRPSFTLSPDGRDVIVGKVAAGETIIVPIDGGPHRAGPKLEPHDVIVDYAPDGASISVQAGPRRIPLLLYNVDLATGARTLWRDHMPANRAGLVSIRSVFFSRDRSVMVLGCARNVGDLYVIRGLA